MNHVTPPTAQRLKAAGFPQPEKQVGQFWVDYRNRYWVIGITGETQSICARRLEPSIWIYAHEELDELVFAPTTEWIMAALRAHFEKPENQNHPYEKGAIVGLWKTQYDEENAWMVELGATEGSVDTGDYCFGKNAAEAAAKLFLLFNETTPA